MKISIVTLSILTIMSLSSCATMEEIKDGIKVPDKMKQFSLQGCGTGAAAGGVLGFLRGGTNDALIGAALGCGIGSIIGFNLGKRTQHYVNAGQAIDSEVARNKRSTKTLKGYNAKLDSRIRSYKSQIQKVKLAKLAAQDKQKRLNNLRTTVRGQLNDSRQALNTVTRELSISRQQYSTYRVKATPAKGKQWQTDITKLEREKNILNKHVKSLTALSSSI